MGTHTFTCRCVLHMCSRCVAMYVLLPCVHICLKKEEDEKLEERRGEEVGRRREEEGEEVGRRREEEGEGGV